MKSKVTREFRKCLRTLPHDARRQAFGAYRLFKRNPFHPSLQFKAVSRTPLIYSVRIGLHYRALGNREADDLIVWFWIGSHADYDDLIGR